MFEIGFQEILMVALLALIVLGPEKLPKLAAKVGHWTGRARSMARNLRAQLEQEVGYEELLKQKQAAEEALRRAQQAPMNFHPELGGDLTKTVSEQIHGHAEPAPTTAAADTPSATPAADAAGSPSPMKETAPSA